MKMETNEKKYAWYALGAVAGLVVLFFVGRQASNWWDSKQEKTQRKEVYQQTLATLRQACRYADSVGIDTSRYTAINGEEASQLTNRLADLMVELQYGKKSSQLAFDGLKKKENVDSSAVQTAAEREIESGKFSVAALQGASRLTPYNQLVGEYNRLRQRTQTAALTDSLRLVRQTLNFYRYINRFDLEKFVVVNIPAAELNVFDKAGKRLLPMRVIAGRADKQTPLMTTYITGIIAYPYWNVPESIALNEMLPKMQRDLSYIYNQNLQVLDAKDKEVDPEEIDWQSLSATNFPYRIRQASGCDNSLGLLKFDLANPLAIYLHDTNSRDLFTATSDHWRSHGCVRVQKPVELANLVLGKPVFDPTFMNKCLIDQKPKPLTIPKQIPVFITYNIADVDASGKLRFYKDVYAMNKKAL
jgi:murein L,D-transpeptidase YcbB/YkuD